jgi:AcrR family transcriptional regulator
MDDIVSESGLSKGALYWYFKSKDDIIAEILNRFFSRELRGLQDLLRSQAPASERLMLFTSYVAAELERMAGLMPIAYEFYAVAARQESVRESLRGYFKDYRRGLATLIQDGIARGELQAVDAEEVAIAIVAIYEGLLLLWTLDPEAFDWGAMAERSLRLLLQGLEAGT